MNNVEIFVTGILTFIGMCFLILAGADSLGEQYVNDRGYTIYPFPAD